MKEQILELYQRGIGTTSIAKQLNIPYNRVRNIIVENCGINKQFRYKDPEYNTRFGNFFYIKTCKDNNQKRWVCRCMFCNSEKTYKPNNIVKNHIKSCGCYQYKVNGNFRGCGDVNKTYYTSLQKKAEERNLPFEVSIEYLDDLYKKQNKKCALTGIEIYIRYNHGKQRLDHNDGSLDRIDSSKGYIEGNVQWVHKWINIMKWNLTQENFIKMCELVTNHKRKNNATNAK